jgi:hypothetical protein
MSDNSFDDGSDQSSSEADQEVRMQSCVATGIPVPVLAKAMDKGLPLAPSSAVGLWYLEENPETDWVRVCVIDTPVRKQWLFVTPDNEDEFAGHEDYTFAHGAVFTTDVVEATMDSEEAGQQVFEDQQVLTETKIEEQLWLGSGDDRAVTREMLGDEEIMEMYRAFRDRVENPDEDSATGSETKATDNAT